MLKSSVSPRVLVAAVMIGGLISTGGSAPVSAQPPAKPFPLASIHMEQNATDADLEVVFEVTGLTDGLTKVKVTGPDGRIVADFSAPDATTLGVRKFRMESPEPRERESVKKAYPEGTYRFEGVTAGGERLQSEATRCRPSRPSCARWPKQTA